MVKRCLFDSTLGYPGEGPVAKQDMVIGSINSTAGSTALRCLEGGCGSEYDVILLQETRWRG